MHGLQTINALEQRLVDNAEAQRILQEHGINIPIVSGDGMGATKVPYPQPVAITYGVEKEGE